ncbi:cytochrome P450 [Trichoderma longibrachiatum]
MFGILVAGVVTVICLFIHHQYYQKKNAFLKLPPGPKPLPIVGNIFDLPPPGTPEFQHWLKFKNLYGPISSITVLGRTMIILNDKQAADDILNKLSLKTSSRPKSVFAYELCGFQNFTPGRSCDATFRLHRRFMHQQAGTKAIAAQYHGIHDVESRRLLKRSLDDPNNLVQHFKTGTAAMILKIVYSYSIEPNAADPLVELIDEMMSNFSEAMVPSSRLVDLIPALKHLPDWFPGTSYKETARQWNKINHDTVNFPYSFVKRQMASGTHRPSMVSDLIERYTSANPRNGEMDHDKEDAIKWAAGIMYGGGSDTTVAALTSFILAIALFPDAQQRAQEEIDGLIGAHPERLPQFEDQGRLPYTSALVKEVLRWYGIVHISTAHVADEDITYGGYCIPKASYLLPIVWWFHHDPQTYRDPFVFSPESFLEPRNEPEPDEAFGWGRRICPGRYISDDNLFITIARILAVFNIAKAVDRQGNSIGFQVEYTPGLVSHPAKLPSTLITARSERHEELIRCIEVDHPSEKSDASLLETEEGLKTSK